MTVAQETPNISIAALKKKRRFYKNPLFYVPAAIFSVLLVVVVAFASKPKSESYVTAQVLRGELEQTVESTGEITAVERVDLSFQNGGTIAVKAFEVGDTVQVGDVIFRLVGGEAQADLLQAQEQVNKSQAALDTILEGATVTQIVIAQANVDSAQVDLENTLASYESAIDAAFIERDSAQRAYEHQLEKNSEDEVQLFQDLQALLYSSVIEIRSALSDADEILGVENTLANQDFEIYLSANNPQALINAKHAYGLAAEYRDLAENSAYALVIGSTNEEIVDGANIVIVALDYTSDVLLYTRRTLDSTIVDTAELSQADISAYKATIDTARAAIQTKQEALLTQIQLIYSTAISIKTTNDSFYDAYLKAEQAYVSAQSDYTTKVAVAQAVLAKAQASYDDTVAGARTSELNAAVADVAIARAQLSAASARFEKTEIRSPIKGIITDIVFSLGESAGAGSRAVTVQALQDTYKIDVNVSESDIMKVSLNDPVEITFDAYGDDLVVEGLVGKIDPAQIEIEGVVYYHVEVFIEKDTNIAMKPGMSADLIIHTENRIDALSVSQRAVLERIDGTKYVRVVNDSGYEERDVTIGLHANGGALEILSGLEEGEIIVVSLE